MMKNSIRILIFILPLVFLGSVESNDWPRFLGPEGNGTVQDDSLLNTDWDSKPPSVLWSAQIGVGHSAFAVSDGKAITIGHNENLDTVWCFDAKSGEVLWKNSYDESIRSSALFPGGPSSTPTIDVNRIYTVSQNGKLHCFDFESGQEIWKKDFKRDFKARKPGLVGWASSPVVYGDLLLIVPGSKKGPLVALDKRTGDLVWASGKDRHRYSTPVIYRKEGSDYAAVLHSWYLVGYDLQNMGEAVFRFKWGGLNASTPNYRNGRIHISGSIIDISDEKPKVLHKNDSILALQGLTSLLGQTSVLVKDRIIAHYGDRLNRPGLAALVALDFNSGKVVWRHQMPGEGGNTIAIGDYILISTDSGHVVIGQDEGDRFRELGRMKALQARTTTAPAYADGRIYLRDETGKAICLDVSK